MEGENCRAEGGIFYPVSRLIIAGKTVGKLWGKDPTREKDSDAEGGRLICFANVPPAFSDLLQMQTGS